MLIIVRFKNCVISAFQSTKDKAVQQGCQSTVCGPF